MDLNQLNMLDPQKREELMRMLQQQSQQVQGAATGAFEGLKQQLDPMMQQGLEAARGAGVGPEEMQRMMQGMMPQQQPPGPPMSPSGNPTLTPEQNALLIRSAGRLGDFFQNKGLDAQAVSDDIMMNPEMSDVGGMTEKYGRKAKRQLQRGLLGAKKIKRDIEDEIY